MIEPTRNYPGGYLCTVCLELFPDGADHQCADVNRRLRQQLRIAEETLVAMNDLKGFKREALRVPGLALALPLVEWVMNKAAHAAKALESIRSLEPEWRRINRGELADKPRFTCGK